MSAKFVLTLEKHVRVVTDASDFYLWCCPIWMLDKKVKSIQSQQYFVFGWNCEIHS